MTSTRSDAFAQRLVGAKLADLRRLPQSQNCAVWTAQLDDMRVLVRHPKHAEAAQRAHDAMLRLAEHAGVPQWVMPSVLAEMNGADVMITEHAPPEHVPADLADLSVVGEETRYAAALLDFLSAQCDRIPKNLLVAPSGAIRLIDHDESFGLGPVWHQRRSIFLPGSALAFAGEPQTPKWVSELTDFGLLPQEMALLQARAQLVCTHGLLQADAITTRLHAHMRVGEWRLDDQVLRLGDDDKLTVGASKQLSRWHLHAEGADWFCYFLSTEFQPSARLRRETDDVWVGEGVRLRR